MSILLPENARTLSMPNKFGGRVFFTPGRLKTLRELLGEFDEFGYVSTDDARVNYEWNVRVVGRPYGYTPVGPINPWDLDEHYDEDSSNADQLAIVNSDAEAAVDYALRWLVTGDVEAAAISITILRAWSEISGFDSSSASLLNWCNKWPVFLQAANMMQDHPDYTPALHAALQSVTEQGLGQSVAYTHHNNFAAWGLVLEIASAGFIGDQARFRRAIRRWRSVFDGCVVNNIPVDEVYRQGGGYGNGSSGLWYSNFFLDGMTAAAEWARFYGEWLYDYRGIDGSTFKGLWENVRYWTRYPALFPYNTSGTPSTTVRIMAHDDILHALWPHAESQWLLDNFTTGSVRDNYGMRQAVLCYRGRPLYG